MDQLTANPQPPARHSVFLGPTGTIRAGWAAVLFILAFVACQFVISIIFRPFIHPHHASAASLMPGDSILSEAIALVCVIVATGVLAVLERKPILSYGFQGAARATRFVWGLVWGFIAISVLVLALWKAHLLVFTGHHLHDGSAVKYAILWGIMFLIVAFTEESLLRGYLQYTITRGIGFWWAALIFSFAFGFGHGHNPGESPIGLVSAGLIGLVFCLSLWYTGSLWWAVGFHATWDWGESYFYGVSDSGLKAHGHLFSTHPLGQLLWSGGKTGPEGSLFILPLIGLIALFMWLWWRRRAQSPFAGCAWRPAWMKPQAANQSLEPSH